jgi:hypothetical protein
MLQPLPVNLPLLLHMRLLLPWLWMRLWRLLLLLLLLLLLFRSLPLLLLMLLMLPVPPESSGPPFCDVVEGFSLQKTSLGLALLLLRRFPLVATLCKL